MGSSSSEETVNTRQTTNAVDRRVVTDSGAQIFDSIVENNDPAVIAAALNPQMAMFETMVRSQSINVLELAEMGNKIQELVAKSQIQMTDKAFAALEEAMQFVDGMLKQNLIVLDFADAVVERAFDSTDHAINVISDRENSTFDLLAEVKTGDFKSLSTSIMIFALVAIYLVTKEGKANA